MLLVTQPCSHVTTSRLSAMSLQLPVQAEHCLLLGVVHGSPIKAGLQVEMLWRLRALCGSAMGTEVSEFMCIVRLECTACALCDQLSTGQAVGDASCRR